MNGTSNGVTQPGCHGLTIISPTVATTARIHRLNRFMHVASHSDKVLPFPPSMRELGPEISEVRNRIAAAVRHARARGPMRLSGDARPDYEAFYRAVRTNDTAGLPGQVTARSAPHVLRLALLYALLDRGDEVDAVQVEAALSLWRYCWSTARWVYGFSLGDPIADELWNAVSVRPEGMTRTEILDWFSRNKKRSEIDRALQLIQEAGLLRRLKKTPSGGGPTIERYVPSVAETAPPDWGPERIGTEDRSKRVGLTLIARGVPPASPA